MYIKNIHIENFRNFHCIDIPLKKLTIVIGENDAGKTNFLDAVRLVLNNNGFMYSSRSLSITDINKDSADVFLNYLKDNTDEITKNLNDNEFMKAVYEKIPIVKVRISFADAKTEYQKQLLKDWINLTDEEEICFEVEYSFAPTKLREFIEECLFLQDKVENFMLPVEKYEYRIYSVNNFKGINKDKLKNFNISVINAERDEKKEYIKEATALSQAETLCRSLLDLPTKQEIEFFKSIKAGLCKCGGRVGITSNEINARIMTMLEQAIEQDGVYNIFAQAGKKNPEISILSDEYMDKIRKMKHKNIAAEMLRKLLEDNIRVFARTGVVKSQLFSEKMQKLLKIYNNRLITSAEVIEELLNLSREMTEAYKAGDEKGLSVEELAFYDALAADPEVLKKMQDEVLVEMAQELTELIRRSRTVDWDKKESARAYMRTQVKHLLRKYKYPPEKAKGAIDIVIKQAELMSSNIKPESVVYDLGPWTKPLMVAEDSVYGMNEKDNI